MSSGQSIKELDPTMDADHREILQSLRDLLQRGKMTLVIRGDDINEVAFFFRDDESFYDVDLDSTTEITLDAEFKLED